MLNHIELLPTFRECSLPKPHYMLFSFYIWVVLMVAMIVLSLITEKSPGEQEMPTLAETYRQAKHSTKKIWLLWGVLAVVMIAIYIIFN